MSEVCGCPSCSHTLIWSCLLAIAYSFHEAEIAKVALSACSHWLADIAKTSLLDHKLAIHVLKSLEADVMIATIHVARQENSVCNTEVWGDFSCAFLAQK